MSGDKKFLKKKEREKKVKEKMAVRRETIRKVRAEQRSEELRMELEHEMKYGKPEPILNDPEAVARRELKKRANVEERLKRNLSILEALEAEYDQEQEVRTKVNEKLEAEGHTTIKDKLNAMHKKAKEIQDIMSGVSKAGQGATPAELTDAEIGLAGQVSDKLKEIGLAESGSKLRDAHWQVSAPAELSNSGESEK